jgi:hypothetical protein
MDEETRSGRFVMSKTPYEELSDAILGDSQERLKVLRARQAKKSIDYSDKYGVEKEGNGPWKFK